MPKVSCTRRLQFCAGHRVHGHENKCANLHGHNFVTWLTAEADQLDSIGRIIDFSVLKEKLGGWIDKYWDHGFLYWSGDYECKTLFCANEDFLTSKSFALPVNPTAENLALYLLDTVGPEVLKGTGVRLTRVVVDETENCSAEASHL